MNKKRLKIAFIASNINVLGGVERVVSILASLFSKHMDVTIFSLFSEVESKNHFKFSENVEIVHLSEVVYPQLLKNSFCKKTLLKFFLLVKIKNLVQKNQIDFLVSTSVWVNSMLPLISLSTKLILCEHACYNNVSCFYRIFRFFSYRLADAVVLLSEFEKNKYKFIQEKKRHVIPNPLSFENSKQSLCDNQRILYIGRFSKEKNIFALLEVAQLLKKELNGWYIDIFGEGPEKENLMIAAEKMRLGDFVRFQNPTDQIQKELEKSSIHVLTSNTECLPMCILEAQACGVPTVAFDCDSGPRMILKEGYNGFLIPMKDVEKFAQTIKMLAKNQELLRTCGQNAKEHSYNYSWDRIYALWQNLLGSL